MNEQFQGFAEDEVRTDEPTRSARLKWVIVVDSALPLGRIVNAAACVAAATSPAVSGLLADGGPDADGSSHAGMPWSGCTVLSADAAKLRQIREKAERREDVLLVDMPKVAQETRVYDEYLELLAGLSADGIEYAAVSLVGPRHPVDRIVGGLSLLS